LTLFTNWTTKMFLMVL